MKLTIQSVHFDASQQLKDFANQKVAKLDHFFDGILSAEVVLSLDKADNTENKVSKISSNTKNKNNAHPSSPLETLTQNPFCEQISIRQFS